MNLLCFCPILISVTILKIPGTFGDEAGNFKDAFPYPPEEYESYQMPPQYVNYKYGFKEIKIYEEVGSAVQYDRRTEKPVPPSVKWSRTDLTADHSVLVGQQSNLDIFVCRLITTDEIIPGKYHPNDEVGRKCWAALDSKEISERDASTYEVLYTCGPGQYQWKPLVNEVLPTAAVIGGHNQFDEPYFICRGSIDTPYWEALNNILPGKFLESTGKCTIPFFPGVHTGRNVEILVANPNITCE